MELTPRDIQDKQFHDSFRGYAHEEVDAFLDEVAQAFDKMYRDYATLERRVAELEERPAESRVAEEMLRKTIYSAQRTATEAVEEAQAAASKLVADAESRARELAGIAETSVREVMAAAEAHAEEMLSRARATEHEVEARIAGLRTFEREYRSRLAALLEDQLRALADTSTVAPAEIPPVMQLPVLPPLILDPDAGPGPEAGAGPEGEPALSLDDPEELEERPHEPPLEIVRDQPVPKREDRRPRPSAHLERAEAEPRGGGVSLGSGGGSSPGGDTVVMTWPDDAPTPRNAAEPVPESGVLRVVTGPARVRSAPMAPVAPASRPEPPGPPQGPVRRQDTRPSTRGDGLDEEEHQSITRLFWGGDE